MSIFAGCVKLFTNTLSTSTLWDDVLCFCTRQWLEGGLNCTVQAAIGEQILLFACVLSSMQQTLTWQVRMALMRRAVTAKSWLKTCCPQSRLSLELSGEAKEISLLPLVQLILYFSAAKVACKQSLIAALCHPAALLIEFAQWIKVTGSIFWAIIGSCDWIQSLEAGSMISGSINTVKPCKLIMPQGHGVSKKKDNHLVAIIKNVTWSSWRMKL